MNLLPSFSSVTLGRCGLIFGCLIFVFGLVHFTGLLPMHRQGAASSVAFLVRTYQGHFERSEVFNIYRMLDALLAFNNRNWVAFLVNTDQRPLPDLPEKYSADARIKVLQLSDSPKKYDEWVAGYDITDQAIYAKELSEFDWIVITNGDNIYGPEFLDELPHSADIVLVDYWSRYIRTGYDLDPVDMNERICHVGVLKSGYVDLGGVLLSLKRFRKEGHKFMDFGAINAQDGAMFALLQEHDWKIHHVKKCLFCHSPNPYMCRKLGGTWFGSVSFRAGLGDSCWSSERVVEERKKHPGMIWKNGILVLPEEEHKKSLENLRKDQEGFARDFVNRLKVFRQPYCNKLKQSGYILDLVGYANMNEDLKSFEKQSEILKHFWEFGCVETRSIPKAPSGYAYGKF